MIETFVWTLNAAACLLVSWVAGSYLLSLGRPSQPLDLIVMFSALGIAVYGVAVAFAPLRWDAVPPVFAIGWRLSLATAAGIFYERHFGWRVLAACLVAVPRGWLAWWRHHVDVGRVAGRSRRSR